MSPRRGPLRLAGVALALVALPAAVPLPGAQARAQTPALNQAQTPAAVQVQGQSPAASAAFGRHELPIHDAARMGQRAEVERLLAARAADRDARAPLGATPLHYAALNQDAGPLRALLAAGADPNARDAEGRTPLHMAAFATRTEHAQQLLRAGADPLLKTHDGRDVLSMARKVRADELAGVVSLWILKGCSKARPC